jgi:hypothetical protein
MNQSETIGKLAEALARAQGQMAPALKDAKNPHLRNKYADLGSVWDACRVPLADNGLSVAQGIGSELITHPNAGGGVDVWGWIVRCDTLLSHSSGEWISQTLTLPAVEQKGISMAQAIGIAATYARRYGLSALVGITQEDNDGHVGQRRAPKERPAAKKARQDSHHPSWPEDQAGFNASLKQMGWKYEEIKSRIHGHKPGAKKPSQLSTKGRATLLKMIHRQETPFEVEASP